MCLIFKFLDQSKNILSIIIKKNKSKMSTNFSSPKITPKIK